MDIDDRILHEIEEFTWLFERKKYLKCSISCKNMLQLLQGIRGLNDDSLDSLKMLRGVSSSLFRISKTPTTHSALTNADLNLSQTPSVKSSTNALNNAQRHIMRLSQSREK